MIEKFLPQNASHLPKNSYLCSLRKSLLFRDAFFSPKESYQMDEKNIPDLVSTVNGTADREARPKKWYAVHVRSCCEKKVAQKLKSLGINTYLPIQKEVRQWSDRNKIVDVILIPMIIFIELEYERILDIKKLSFIYDFLKAPGQKEPAIIPDYQIEALKYMVGNGDNEVEFSREDYSKGEFVTICRGKLKGLNGYVKADSNGKTKIGIVIDLLGCATVEVHISDLKPIQQ